MQVSPAYMSLHTCKCHQRSLTAVTIVQVISVPSLADQVAEYIRGQHLGISHQDIMLVEIGSNDVRPMTHDVAVSPNLHGKACRPSHDCLLWSVKCQGCSSDFAEQLRAGEVTWACTQVFGGLFGPGQVTEGEYDTFAGRVVDSIVKSLMALQGAGARRCAPQP